MIFFSVRKDDEAKIPYYARRQSSIDFLPWLAVEMNNILNKCPFLSGEVQRLTTPRKPFTVFLLSNMSPSLSLNTRLKTIRNYANVKSDKIYPFMYNIYFVSKDLFVWKILYKTCALFFLSEWNYLWSVVCKFWRNVAMYVWTD